MKIAYFLEKKSFLCNTSCTTTVAGRSSKDGLVEFADDMVTLEARFPVLPFQGMEYTVCSVISDLLISLY